MSNIKDIIKALDITAPKRPKREWGIEHRKIVNQANEKLKILEKIEKLVDEYNEQFYEDEEKAKLKDTDYYMKKIGELLG